MFDAMRGDIRTAAMERDPAARAALEVVLCYPGVHALAFHRLAHRLWGAGWLGHGALRVARRRDSSPGSRSTRGARSGAACSSTTAWAS